MDELQAGAGVSIGIISREQPGQLRSVSTSPVISPQMVYIDMQDERVQDVVLRVQRVIRNTYSDAEFVSYIGTSPLGIYIEVYTDGDEFDGILGILSDKVGNLNIAAGVDVCVVPRRKAKAQAA
ncbi:MAG TPA: hypothetical protein VGE45_19015 [Chloroflexia bacterium]|jgi:hypothetical protein